jgi:hypothetical protein
MPFEQVRDVLRHAGRFHREVADYYRQLQDSASQKRVKMLLDYMGGREEKIAEALADFVDETPKAILDTWFQFADDQRVMRFPHESLKPDMQVDDVMRVAADVRQHVLNAFRDMAGSAETDEVRAVFASLIEQSEEEWHHLARNANLLMDL